MSSELAVLGCAMMSRESAEKVAIALSEDDFSTEANRSLFNAICSGLGADTYDRGVVMTAAEELGMPLDAFLDASEAAQDAIATDANVDLFISQASTRAHERRLTELSRRIASGELSARDAMPLIELEQQRAQQRKRHALEPLKSVLWDVVEEADSEAKDTDGIPTGFRFWDHEIANGLNRSAFVVIGAATGVGKTSFALQVALNVAKEARVLLFSYEMSKKENAKRMLSQCGAPPESKIRPGMSDHDKQLLAAVSGKIQSRKLELASDPSLTVDEVCSICRRESLAGDLGLIVVDYLQLISGNRKETREREVADTSRKLRKLSLGLGVPVIALAQLNRGINARDDKRPRLSDLRESGSIEQDATMVLLLHRPAAFDDKLSPEEAYVIVAKNRHGPSSVEFDARFEPKHTRFVC